ALAARTPRSGQRTSHVPGCPLWPPPVLDRTRCRQEGLLAPLEIADPLKERAMIHRAQHAPPQHGSRKLAPLLYLTIIVSTAAADDGSVWTVGGAVRLMKNHGSVRMVSETVRARVSTEVIEVDCVFTMKNEGTADTVLVGFPDGPIDEPGISSFHSWVDGVAMKCRREPD